MMQSYILLSTLSHSRSLLFGGRRCGSFSVLFQNLGSCLRPAFSVRVSSRPEILAPSYGTGMELSTDHRQPMWQRDLLARTLRTWNNLFPELGFLEVVFLSRPEVTFTSTSSCKRDSYNYHRRLCFRQTFVYWYDTIDLI